MRLFLSASPNVTPLANGSVNMVLKASRLAPGGISPVGRCRLRGSMAMATIHKTGKSTIAVSSSRMSCAPRSPTHVLGLGAVVTAGAALTCSLVMVDSLSIETLRSSGHTVIDQCDDQQDKEDDDAERRRDPVDSPRIHHLVCFGNQDFRSPERPALRDKVDDIELVEGPYRTEHDSGYHRGAYHGHCNVPELLPLGRAVNGRGFIQLAGHALQRACSDHTHEGPTEPDVSDQRGEKGERQKRNERYRVSGVIFQP